MAGRKGCILLPLGTAVASLLLAVVIAATENGTADDFAILFIIFWFCSWLVLGIGFLVKAGAALGKQGGLALRRASGADTSPDLNTEVAALRKMADRSRSSPISGHGWHGAESGGSARFTYIDNDGVVTDRRVRSWFDDGEYIQAYCLDRRASRTFRKDRIEDWRD